MRSALAALLLACLVHGVFWYFQGESLEPPDLEGRLASLSFAPFDPAEAPDDGAVATEEQIRADMGVVAPYTKGIRTYASTGGLELVPGIAQEFGLRVSLGAWIDTDEERNAREIDSALQLASRHHNVQALIVGNEVVLRGEKTAEEMAQLIRQVKQQTDVPVSTGEIWHVWLEHPELVASVDFIAAHVLPYWEGLPAEVAVEHVESIYQQLRAAYPGKHVVIAEFGWPSAGYNRKSAEPGGLLQAEIVRGFADRARDLGIDYNIVEAFDQPWKTFEGSVGAYWGLFDADRQLKFNLEGIVSVRGQEQLGGAALALGALFGLGVLALRRPTFAQALMVALAAQVLGAWLAVTLAHPLSHYLVVGSAIMWGLGLLLLVPLALLSYSRIGEIAAVALGQRPQRLLPDKPVAAPEAAARQPMVSIHVPAYREPPEMLRQTLLSVAQLDYPRFECVVAINNTPDPAFWQPIEQLCRELGPHFKFLNLQDWPGFKAGALREAMRQTAPEAEIVAVLDADYTVDRDWLKDLVPCFADPEVGIVQAPQDHRDGERSAFHGVLNAEYAGFFDIGMVQRNEADAIVVHGTMCLMRRTAMEAAGGWSSDTITEDSDLGLSIMELGWRAHYTRRRYGHGLLPDTYAAFQKQRHRWAYGGLQILKKHWRRLLPGRSRLTWGQRREYLAGWLHWMGAETLGVAAALFNLVWVPVVLIGGVAIPESVLMLPVLIVFAINILHFALLYRLRVALPFRQALGAAVAAMSLQFTMARAVAEGVIRDNLPFRRTDKGGGAKRPAGFAARWEAVIGSLLVLGGALLLATNETEVREINIFAVVLLVQALPFLATVYMALLERRGGRPSRLRRALRALRLARREPAISDAKA